MTTQAAASGSEFLESFASSRLSEGCGRAQLREELAKRGAEDGEAERIIERGIARIRARSGKATAIFLAIGSASLAIGLLVTWLSYREAARDRGYFVSIGLICFGLGFLAGGVVKLIGLAAKRYK